MGRSRRTDAGGAGEFSRFYDDSLPIVLGYATRLCGGDRDEAWDVTQDAWLTLVRALKAGTCREPTTAWMVRVVRSRYIDRWRREQRNDRVRRLTWSVDRDRNDVIDRDFDLDLVPCLDRLPLAERMVLLMFFVDDLAVSDIASELGLSRSGAYALLGRAKESLRGQWEVTSDG